MRQRIQTLDGLRFLAAVGVLWIHSWTTCGNPRCYIRSFDIANILAIGGNGVDLFFVISGFCMYYFYASKSDFSYRDFYRFLVKRWVRLSPAFYAATILYIIIEKLIYHLDINCLNSLLHSVFYLNFILPQYNVAPHFWTLSTEWQFYFTIPFLLIYQNTAGFKKTFSLIFISIFIVAICSTITFKSQYSFLTNTILFRGVEFGCGIVTAKLLLKNNSFFKYRFLWLLVFIITTYTGRILISKKVCDLWAPYDDITRLIGFTLMAAGFAGILYLSVTSVKWLNAILSNKFFKSAGRVSYSFYLLHLAILPFVTIQVMQFLPGLKGIAIPIFITCISTLILYPISLISYNYLEKPFLLIGNLTTK